MRKIAVVTATRAEYGLLKPLLSALKESNYFELQLLVTGMHLMPGFGNTYLEIEEDGFKIDAKIEDGLKGDSALQITKAIGRTTIGFGEVLHRLRPQLIIVLGDRSEILAAVTSAVIANIPVAHIHGGETTEGAYDEFIRHAITKMSHFHFASCEVYRKRIIQMGERPTMVFNVGAIGVDSIKSVALLGKKDFEASISKRLGKRSVLITFHPVTMENNTAEKQFGELLAALDALRDTTLIFTKPNSDKGGSVIIKMIDNYVASNPTKAISFKSLGQIRYLSSLQYVDVVIGNSSSGILEVPYFKIPTINIGDRQKGRLMPHSVICCRPEQNQIALAIKKALDNRFLDKIAGQEFMYGGGNTTEQIIEVLRRTKLNSFQKPFFDIKFNA